MNIPITAVTLEDIEQFKADPVKLNRKQRRRFEKIVARAKAAKRSPSCRRQLHYTTDDILDKKGLVPFSPIIPMTEDEKDKLSLFDFAQFNLAISGKPFGELTMAWDSCLVGLENGRLLASKTEQAADLVPEFTYAIECCIRMQLRNIAERPQTNSDIVAVHDALNRLTDLRALFTRSELISALDAMREQVDSINAEITQKAVIIAKELGLDYTVSEGVHKYVPYTPPKR